MGIGEQLQTALFTRLDSELNEPVFDHVPQDEPYPFVVIGDTDLRPWESYESMGYIAETRIYCYSATAGRLAVNQLMDKIEAALNRKEVEVVLPDYQTVNCHMIFRQPAVEPDGTVRQGRIDFRFIIGGKDAND